METSFFFEWKNLLDLLESRNPRAFNFFYDFHSHYGLKEREIYPSQRLIEIGEISDSDYQQLIHDFAVVALPELSEEQLKSIKHEISEEGTDFYL
jgi:hypothetical protein